MLSVNAVSCQQMGLKKYTFCLVAYFCCLCVVVNATIKHFKLKPEKTTVTTNNCIYEHDIG